MTRILKILFDRKPKEPSPEEIEALNFARMTLKLRVEQIARQTAANGDGRAVA
ncbi:MAG: hypothetical protein ACT4SY_08930 [Hyphomicrobiales bacterium]